MDNTGVGILKRDELEHTAFDVKGGMLLGLFLLNWLGQRTEGYSKTERKVQQKLDKMSQIAWTREKRETSQNRDRG